MDFAERAETFGVRGESVDGMDVELVNARAAELLEHSRGGNGPTFLLADVYRFYGHGRKDPSPYRDKEEEQKWKQRDPVLLQKQRLIDEGLLTEDAFSEIEAEVKQEVEEAVSWAASCTDPDDAELYNDVFVEEI